jgi:hypothetical protein
MLFEGFGPDDRRIAACGDGGQPCPDILQHAAAIGQTGFQRLEVESQGHVALQEQIGPVDIRNPIAEKDSAVEQFLVVCSRNDNHIAREAVNLQKQRTDNSLNFSSVMDISSLFAQSAFARSGSIA